MGYSKYSNDFKQKTLLKGIDIKVAEVKRANYKNITINRFVDCDGEVHDLDFVNDYEKMISKYRNGYNFIDCADRLIESKYRKSKKVRDKITKLVLSNNAIFITLTFNDKTMSKTTAEKRRRLVQRYLKDNCPKYVANVDFGALNGREHYHAVVSQDINLINWRKYGNVNVERVRPCEDSPKRISKYITKLTNHALKVGAIAPRLIYSRNTI